MSGEWQRVTDNKGKLSLMSTPIDSFSWRLLWLVKTNDSQWMNERINKGILSMFLLIHQHTIIVDLLTHSLKQEIIQMKKLIKHAKERNISFSFKEKEINGQRTILFTYETRFFLLTSPSILMYWIELIDLMTTKTIFNIDLTNVENEVDE